MYMSVRRKIVYKILLKALALLLTAAALCGIYYCYHLQLKELSRGFFMIPVLTVIYIIIVFKSKFFQMLFDKDWEGEISGIDVKIAAEPLTFWNAIGRRPLQMIPYTVLTVKKDNGKSIKLTFQSSKISPSVLYCGTNLKHLKGAKYPIFSKTKGDVFFCPICARHLVENICPDCNIKY